MRRAERDDILEWMREHAWRLEPIPPDETESRKDRARRMRRRLNRLYDEAGESRISRALGAVGRGAGLTGLCVLVVDLLTTGGAISILTIVGSSATAIGGAKELYDIVHGRIRIAEKRWISERRDDVDRYLSRLR